MIVTITPNPAVDVSYFLSSFSVGAVHRCTRYHRVAGGKGLNVAKVVHLLGTSVAATGWVGGSNGMFIREELKKLGIEDQFLTIEQDTRTCLTIQAEETTEIRELGPTIDQADQQALFSHLQKIPTDLYTLNGSLPRGIDAQIFWDDLSASVHAPILLDSSGTLLRYAVERSPHKPLLIKPNEEELQELFPTLHDPKQALCHPALQDIPYVILSQGKEGALAKMKDKLYQCTVPRIDCVNPVGSGDSSIAGFAYAIEQGKTSAEILKYGMACGVLNAMEEKIGWIQPEKIPSLLEKIEVKEIL